MKGCAMIVIYSLASLGIAGVLCVIAGTTRPWIAQFSFAALVIGSLATASKISPITDGVYVSVAIGLYSMTFLLANYLREIFGKSFAIRAIWMGLIGEFMFVFATQFALVAPSAPFWSNQAAFVAVYSITPRIFVASVLAYMCAEFSDVHVYHALSRLTKGRHLWLRNNIGTMVGQTIDSAIFYMVAFYGVVPNVFALIITTCIVKYVIAVADTPVFYAVVYWARQGGAGTSDNGKQQVGISG
jgi:uncharacterized integral membrane protein (TIGR00697 family)